MQPSASSTSLKKKRKKREKKTKSGGEGQGKGREGREKWTRRRGGTRVLSVSLSFSPFLAFSQGKTKFS